MTPAQADALASAAAAYVHIPFCKAVCPYCDFAVVAGRDDAIERYVEAVVSEIRMSEPWRTLDAVYFGGGTPSHLPARHLHRILDVIDGQHGISTTAEISLEANPEDFEACVARDLKLAGFNRVSFGAQSFDQDVLLDLGRRHDPERIGRAVEAARAAGFDNLSLDLIFGSVGESPESWTRTVESALALSPDHISSYALTVERGTPLGRAVAAGAPAPDPDAQADRYELVADLLGAAGFEHYEVSNWAQAGRECRYNMTVWARGEYEAYGNGAHGHRHGVRYRNIRRLDAYLQRVESGELPRAGADEVNGWDAEIDRIFVGLRRSVGVSRGPATERLLESTDGQQLVAAGVLGVTPERLMVKRPLLTDSVHRSVLALTGPIVSGDGNA